MANSEKQSLYDYYLILKDDLADYCEKKKKEFDDFATAKIKEAKEKGLNVEFKHQKENADNDFLQKKRKSAEENINVNDIEKKKEEKLKNNFEDEEKKMWIIKIKRIKKKK